MGRCIICGAAVDGRICDIHEEDVVFEFRGNHPNQLASDRYYEGTVDGYADFGVFVDVADGVTGLLHQSEIDRRLESLEWEPGDTVYVQVLRVQNNGNIDLGWSIRQREDRFRGKLIHDPGADDPEYQPDEADSETTRANGGGGATPSPQPVSGAGGAAEAVEAVKDEPDTQTPAEPPERVTVESLDDRVGERITLEGEVVGVEQTGGPTIFEVRDESGVVDVAAFVGAGERAYPGIGVDDHVRVVGEVELRHDELQVESEAIEALDSEEANAVANRLDEAMAAQARPDELEPLAGHEPVETVRESLLDAAEAIRRAVFETRPVVVRHPATADGYVAGAAIERAVLPLVRDEHVRSDAEYHYFDRRPLEDPVYDMADATNDVTDMLQGRDRHDEKLPLVVLVGAGEAVESAEALELLGVYGVEGVVLDVGPVADAVAEEASTVVAPEWSSTDARTLTETALAANLAVAIDSEVSDDVAHLPAVSYWADAPEAYVDLAREAGYDADDARELREAVALEAYYQTYEDKRELITDLLFAEEEATEGDARGLAAHVSEQFREKLDTAVGTAQANVESRESGGVELAVLDADAFAHRFDFPSTELLADALHRERRGESEVTVLATKDELYLRSDARLDAREVADAVAEEVANAGVRAVGGPDGRLKFLAGRRDAVLEAAVEAIAETF